MARYRHYDPEQTKMVAVSYGRQLLPGTFEHALSYLIDHEIDLTRFAERFKNDETGAPAYDPAVLLKVVLFAYSRGITSSRTMARACVENVVFIDTRAEWRSQWLARLNRNSASATEDWKHATGFFYSFNA